MGDYTLILIQGLYTKFNTDQYKEINSGRLIQAD